MITKRHYDFIKRTKNYDQYLKMIEKNEWFLELSDINKLLVDHFGLQSYWTESRSKMPEVTFYRHLAYYLASNYTGSSYREISDYFGGTPSNVSNNLKTFMNKVAKTEKNTKIYDEIEAKIAELINEIINSEKK